MNSQFDLVTQGHSDKRYLVFFFFLSKGIDEIQILSVLLSKYCLHLTQ